MRYTVLSRSAIAKPNAQYIGRDRQIATGEIQRGIFRNLKTRPPPPPMFTYPWASLSHCRGFYNNRQGPMSAPIPNRPLMMPVTANYRTVCKLNFVICYPLNRNSQDPNRLPASTKYRIPWAQIPMHDNTIGRKHGSIMRQKLAHLRGRKHHQVMDLPPRHTLQVCRDQPMGRLGRIGRIGVGREGQEVTPRLAAVEEFPRRRRRGVPAGQWLRVQHRSVPQSRGWESARRRDRLVRALASPHSPACGPAS